MTIAWLAAIPCPRCGCYVAANFECGCGACKSDYCVNCGRWCDLPASEHVELSFADRRCEKGNVLHAHDPAEKLARITEHFDKLTHRGSRSPRGV